MSNYTSYKYLIYNLHIFTALLTKRERPIFLGQYLYLNSKINNILKSFCKFKIYFSVAIEIKILCLIDFLCHPQGSTKKPETTGTL